MIAAPAVVAAAGGLGFRFWSGVPCSYLTPLIDQVGRSAPASAAAAGLRYVPVANEGEAVAACAGAVLGGTRAVAMFQNSGLGNAVSPLTSLTHPFRLPVLLIPTWRGEPGGRPDEPQHELMGGITTRLLELMEIDWEPFPAEEREVLPALERAAEAMERSGRSRALVLRQDAVAPGPAPPLPSPRPPAAAAPPPARATATRGAMLRAVQAAVRPGDVLLATTGYTGRELYGLGDRPNQLYLVGSMGCASSVGLGLALVRPERRVIVIDGDGAALMRLGALATLGHERPPNLLHLLLDNGMHESTGGQPTVSASVSFAGLAAAAGYPRVLAVGSPEELAAEVGREASVLTFIHLPILPGVPGKLPRPELAPADVARRLRGFLAGAP